MVTQLAHEFDDAPNVLVVGDGYTHADLQDAVVIAGGRVVRTLGWDKMEKAELPARMRLVALDLRHTDTAAAAPSVSTLLAAAREAEAGIVAAIAESQIDALSADLVAPDIDLLCDPAPGEWIAAIAISLAGADLVTLHDISSEAARLERLNDEVARIAETLARLTRRTVPAPEPVGGSSFVSDRAIAFGATPVIDADPTDPAEIRATIRARRMRDQLFGRGGLFEDPAWDMLLDLFAAKLEHRQVSVSSLCIAAAVAPTTALRWIGKLIDAKLLDRRPDAFDKRRAFIALTQTAADAMRGYVAAVKRAGLPIA